MVLAMIFHLAQRVRSNLADDDLGTVDMVGYGVLGLKIHVTWDDGSTGFYHGSGLYNVQPI